MIETRLSDGLHMLQPGEADRIVIAGMGGPLMQRILEEGEARRARCRAAYSLSTVRAAGIPALSDGESLLYSE